MSTRCTTHFQYNGRDEAIIYRHSDGHPEGAGTDILRFMDECEKLADSRFGDPAYLAAKYVVFLADMFNVRYDWNNGGVEIRYLSKLQFLSVGVCMRDPGDIEYRYVIDCGKMENGRPVVKCYAVSDKYGEKFREKPMSKWTLTEVPIPAPGVTK